MPTHTTATRRAGLKLAALRKTVLDEVIARRMRPAQAAGLLNMHVKSLSRLRSRYARLGDGVLTPARTGPKRGARPANRTPADVEAAVAKAAADNPWLGPVPLAAAVAAELGSAPHPTTVWRILGRGREAAAPRRADPPRMYCLDEPGIELQMDACFPFGRARGLTVFDAVDDCSRWLCAEAYDGGETIESAEAFVARLVERCPFRIRAIRLDNRFRGPRLRAFCARFGISLVFNEPYCPEQNGKVERYHRTFKSEAVWRTISYGDPTETFRYKLALWVGHYNFRRPHGGLGMDGRTPAQKLTDLAAAGAALVHIW